jgi:hypothetical protein
MAIDESERVSPLIPAASPAQDVFLKRGVCIPEGSPAGGLRMVLARALQNGSITREDGLIAMRFIDAAEALVPGSGRPEASLHRASIILRVLLAQAMQDRNLSSDHGPDIMRFIDEAEKRMFARPERTSILVLRRGRQLCSVFGRRIRRIFQWRWRREDFRQEIPLPQ